MEAGTLALPEQSGVLASGRLLPVHFLFFSSRPQLLCCSPSLTSHSVFGLMSTEIPL
jgi:hypothetical protein